MEQLLLEVQAVHEYLEMREEMYKKDF